MHGYDFTRRAVRDITSARDWYDRRGPKLGNRFLDSVLSAIREAREHPVKFHEIEPGVRAVGCVGFPYRVYYQVLPTKIIVALSITGRAIRNGGMIEIERDPCWA